MNKYIFTIALSICATLSSMEQTHKLTILVPSPRKLHITFRKKGYGVWAEETKIPEIEVLTEKFTSSIKSDKKTIYAHFRKI